MVVLLLVRCVDGRIQHDNGMRSLSKIDTHLLGVGGARGDEEVLGPVVEGVADHGRTEAAGAAREEVRGVGVEHLWGCVCE